MQDASQKDHESRLTSSRRPTYAQARHHRTARKRRMPTQTHSKTLQDRDEAAQLALTRDHGLQRLPCHNHRREHIPRRHHDDYLHEMQTGRPERTVPQGSAPRALDSRTIPHNNRDNDSESKELMPEPKPTRVPASGQLSTSDERCHACTQAMKP
jgi:hypothetical protein